MKHSGSCELAAAALPLNTYITSYRMYCSSLSEVAFMPSGSVAFHGRNSRAKGSRKEEGVREGLTEVHLKVTGMTCRSCVANIEKSLAKLIGESLYTTLLYPWRSVWFHSCTVLCMNLTLGIHQLHQSNGRTRINHTHDVYEHICNGIILICHVM